MLINDNSKGIKINEPKLEESIKKSNLIYEQMPDSISAECYKLIRTSIKYSSVDKEIKTIVITSSVPGEGKSTVAGNLAVSLSENGGKALLIDCDLRKPTIHKKFNLSNYKGLTDILIDKCPLKDVIQVYKNNLHIISAGTIPPNPAEILGSKTMERFIAKIALDYDYVILDTAPLLAVTDAQLLAAKSDGTILVVKYGKTREKQILQSHKELKKVNAKVIGSILNQCDVNKNGTYYHYYSNEKKSLFKRIFKR